MIKDYEAIFIFNNQEAVYQSSLEKVKAIFDEAKVKVQSEEDMGVRDLAYLIGKADRGHYYLFNLKSEGPKLKGVEKELRLLSELIRYMIIRREVKFIHKKPKKVRHKAES
jgi:small subunit ribosomal protein S6